VTFVQPPFWAHDVLRGRAGPHALSRRVTPAIAIVSSSIASPTVITTLTPHELLTGDTVAIAAHVGATPALSGAYIVTVLGTTSLSLPIAVTVAGTGGTLTQTIAVEPLTVAQLKLRANLDWDPGDPRDVGLTDTLAAARRQVEHDTGLCLRRQWRDVSLDRVYARLLTLPAQSQPLQRIDLIESTDSAGVAHTLATDQYDVDLASGRIGLTVAGVWPTDLRELQPYRIRLVAGYPTIAALAFEAPDLLDAVGLWASHAATTGRDRFTAAALRDEYDERIAPYRWESVA